MKLIESNTKQKYYATEDGHIYSERMKKNLFEETDKDGYKKVRLALSGDGSRKKFFVHRLILQAFNPIENCENFQVNHIDGNKGNNKIENLEWVTPKQNIAHAYYTGLRKNFGDNNNGPHILTSAQVVEIIPLILSEKYTYEEIGKRFGVSSNAIKDIKTKRTWKHLTKDIDFYKGSTTNSKSQANGD